ncbi:SIP domain-containing protein [Polaribacter sp. R2A056_3_33]|uniref:siderophore-interacting protein n=1 Tax=Polaribacter sp. R2A056_3_33 TaxID=2745563 RepID=UPI001C4F0E85|nr:SIP domain-containing protein [Polaribacter sp. R2A056_3_33]QXP71637.1 SIP domain-containing protein [Polaribacter sp. R2A056_3_33]
MGLLENIIKKVVLEAAIIEHKEKISASVYKIRLKSESIKKADFKPGYFLRLGIGIGNDNLSMKDKVRSYSVWDINQTEGYLDIAIATDSKGIGSQWVANCLVGETVYFKWKKGNFLLDETAESYLMIGDLSALSHLYILNRNLPNNKQVESILYSESQSAFFDDIGGSKPFNRYYLKQNPINEIIKKVKKITPKLKENKIVYIAGDSRVCVALNKYFRNELNWSAKQIKTKPFWNPDKKGLE